MSDDVATDIDHPPSIGATDSWRGWSLLGSSTRLLRAAAISAMITADRCEPGSSRLPSSSDGKFRGVIPSDHNPVLADLTIPY